ncbi:MAG TPA: adenosylmethionine decarboxylase [Spirochaetes bacterium]|nr:adenosylmethionine decarboxylase [Spirochaetota bacterium]
MEGLGTHVIAELFDCNEFHINDVKKVEEVLMAAAELSSATIIKPFFHKFSPYGISGVIVIAESHFTIHTWPEHGYAAVDIFTCGDLNYQVAMEHIKNELGAERCTIFQFERGILPDKTRENSLPAFREVENAGYFE